MSNLCFLIVFTLFSCFIYGNECASQFMEKAVRDVQHIQEGLESSNKKQQLTALRKIRDIKPDNTAINNWVLPFLQSKDVALRFSALRIITDSIDMYPQFVSTLLIHLRHETSHLIINLINDKMSHITPFDKKAFYQGKDIVDNIELLNVHLNKLNQWFIQLGIQSPSDTNRWINKVLQKNTEDRNTIEQETFNLYRESAILTGVLKKSLLNIPPRTYEDFIHFLKKYVKYSGHPVFIDKDVNNLIQLIYLDFHKTNTN